MKEEDQLSRLTKKELVAEVIKLRNGIRKHRDNTGHNLCWYVPELWNLLPEKVEPKPDIPATKEFLMRCKKYRKSLDK